MKLTFEDIAGSKFVIDKASVGRIMGGATVATGSGRKTYLAGTPDEYTFTYSADTETWTDTTPAVLQGTVYHTTTETNPIV